MKLLKYITALVLTVAAVLMVYSDKQVYVQVLSCRTEISGLKTLVGAQNDKSAKIAACVDALLKKDGLGTLVESLSRDNERLQMENAALKDYIRENEKLWWKE